jgi:hypothetical protein
MRLVPVAIATVNFPLLRAYIAISSATMLLEQAISIVMLGLCQSKKYETQFETTARSSPVAAYYRSDSQLRTSIVL